MSYNQVGTPRFFIDYFGHWKEMGMINNLESKDESVLGIYNYNDSQDFFDNMNLLGLDPTNNISFSIFQNNENPLAEFGISFNKYLHRNYLSQIDYIGYLGHTFTEDGLLDNYRNEGQIWNKMSGVNNEQEIVGEGNFDIGDVIINAEKKSDNEYRFPFNGFSLLEVDYNSNDKYYFYDTDGVLQETDDPDYPGAINSLDLINTIEFQTKYQKEENEEFMGHFGLGALTMGHTYTMPHSPELSLSFEIEYDGYDQVQTLGGRTLTKVNYSGSPQWSFGSNPWEIYPHAGTFVHPVEKVFNSDMRRKGRRTWNLKFSYLNKKDLFSANHSTNNYYDELGNDVGGESHSELESNSDITKQASGWVDINNNNMLDLVDLIYMNQNNLFTDLPLGDWTSTQNPWNFTNNMLTDDSFESRVLNFIGNGQKFIFQPDSNSNQPSDFAICVLDQDSIKATQVANGVYNISLKIREVW